MYNIHKIKHTALPESIDPFAMFLPRDLHVSMMRYSCAQPRLYLGKTEDRIRPAAAAFKRGITSVRKTSNVRNLFAFP